MERLELKDVAIHYGTTAIIRNLRLSIQDGELVSLLGPSGAGKTTILKTIAGLLPVTAGNIYINGQCVNHLPAEKRDAVLIFQKPLLFPFLNVKQNIGFGLKMKHVDKKTAGKRIEKILEITGLQGLENRKIHQLSGGQQQRVALARGLVLEPAILLLDEPLSNLDPGLRGQMRDLICSLQTETGTTMLFVTHDQSEALAISDRICLLLDGTLRQKGRPEELFYHPADPAVARFFGCDNILPSSIFLPKHPSGEKKELFVIRPEDIEIKTDQGSANDAQNYFDGTVRKISFEGQLTKIIVNTSGHRLTVLCRRPSFHPGQTVWLRFPEELIHFFQEPETGDRILNHGEQLCGRRILPQY
jgi:ABC-type sugar transport system ATPase subunit